MRGKIFLQGIGGDPSRGFYHYVRVLAFHERSRFFQLRRGKIVKHDHVRPCGPRFLRLRQGLALDLYFDGKGTHPSRRSHGLGDASRAPDVIVLEHDHLRQILPVCGRPSDQQSVFFHHSKAGSGLAGARNGPMPPCATPNVHRSPGDGGDPTCPSQNIQGRAFSKQNMACFAFDCCHMDLYRLLSASLVLLSLVGICGCVTGYRRRQHRSIFHSFHPLHRAIQRFKDRIKKNFSTKDPFGFSVEERSRKRFCGMIAMKARKSGVRGGVQT
jgi:hypothetical protein